MKKIVKAYFVIGGGGYSISVVECIVNLILINTLLYKCHKVLK